MERGVEFGGNFVSFGIFLFRKRMRLVNGHSNELGIFCLFTVLWGRPFFSARITAWAAITTFSGSHWVALQLLVFCLRQQWPRFQSWFFNGNSLSSSGNNLALMGYRKELTILIAFLQRARSHHSTSKCLEQFEFQFPYHHHPPVPVSWAIFHLEHYYPIEFSTMTEMFYICSMQYGSSWPHVAIEHLIFAYWNWGNWTLT